MMRTSLSKTKPKARSSLRQKKKLHTREQCLKLAQQLCKLRELNEYGRLWCISCNKPLTMGDNTCQGGHLISRQDRAVETEPDNLWPQCSTCNCLMHGNVIAYRYNLVRLIGRERVERIEDMSMARKGNEEAYERLSPADRTNAMMKKSARYYDSLWYELNMEIKNMEEKDD